MIEIKQIHNLVLHICMSIKIDEQLLAMDQYGGFEKSTKLVHFEPK